MTALTANHVELSTGTVHLYNMFLPVQVASHLYAKGYSPSPYCILVLHFSALTYLANLHNFLICTLSFSVLTLFDCLHFVTLAIYFSWEYHS
jgi:hypothetical protein